MGSVLAARPGTLETRLVWEKPSESAWRKVGASARERLHAAVARREIGWCCGIFEASYVGWIGLKF